jgi:transposase
MLSTPSLRPLYTFSGWVIKEMKLNSDIAMVRLRKNRRYGLQCPVCSRKNPKENKRIWQNVRDLPLGIVQTVMIHYEAIQVRCEHCNTFSTILPPDIDRNSKATKRLMRYVSKMCRFMPVNKVPEFIPISESTARRWDKKILQETIPDPDLDSLRVLLVDEKSIGKHHHYMTVVINGDTGEVLHLAEGKKKESLAAFFEKMSAEQIASIEAVGIDRAGSYKSAVQKYAPHAAIVFDKFHLIANCNQAVDEVRRAEWRKADDGDKAVIKGHRFNLLKNRENLKPEQKVRLKSLLELNEPLFEAYLLKDALKPVWNYKYKKAASSYLDRWIFWAKESMLEPFVKYAKGLDRDRAEILSFIKHRITSGKIEAFNATIARIIRRACGYRDLEYLYLKIRQEALKSSQT